MQGHLKSTLRLAQPTLRLLNGPLKIILKLLQDYFKTTSRLQTSSRLLSDKVHTPFKVLQDSIKV